MCLHYMDLHDKQHFWEQMQLVLVHQGIFGENESSDKDCPIETRNLMRFFHDGNPFTNF